MLVRAVSVAALLTIGACGERPADPAPAGQQPMTTAERLEYRRNVAVTILKVTPVRVAAGRPPVVRVVGDVANRGNRELGAVHLVFSFKGNGGRAVQEEVWFPVLVGGVWVDADKPLAPNETRRFDVDFNVAAELTAHVDVRVEAIQPTVVTELIR